MQLPAGLLLFAYLRLAAAHGDHGHDGPADGETIQQYAQRHMASEHHIDSFDVASFFQLHDLNRDKVWDREEIEAVYGVHHVYSQKKSKDDIEHQKKADHIVDTVLKVLDKDKDGKVSLEELEAVGVDGLPNFDDLGAEGHHYDIESEFFLHHEEQFHSTPETQGDDSYTHPEDLEHFAHHEAIERKEAEREAKFQGITVEEALKQHEHDHNEAPPPAGQPGSADHEKTGDAQVVHNPNDDTEAPPPVLEDAPLDGPPRKINRVVPPEKQDPVQRFASAKAEAEKHGEWGQGDSGYKPPKKPAERMRKNVPYKYKFRRTWGDF